jgi:Zn finger protein HypA/HybF involved in hydrogenase expression
MEPINKLLTMLCLVFMTANAFAQVQSTTMQAGTDIQVQKSSMSIKCDCCNTSIPVEKMADHLKACCTKSKDPSNKNTYKD